MIIDGKKVRHGGVEIVNAVNSEGRFLGSVMTGSASNEIPAGRRLLGKQDWVGKIVLADALHTQDETARQILHQQGGDYLLTVKGNQGTVQKTLEILFARQAFSPSTHGADSIDEAGAQPGAAGDPLAGVQGSHAQPGGLPWSATGGPIGDTGPAQREMVPGGGLSAEQFDPPRAASPGDAFAQARLLGY